MKSISDYQYDLTNFVNFLAQYRKNSPFLPKDRVPVSYSARSDTTRGGRAYFYLSVYRRPMNFPNVADSSRLGVQTTAHAPGETNIFRWEIATTSI